MTWRFRQTFRLLPGLWLNIGKRGVSVSSGIPGARVTVGPTGVRGTLGLPGTGLSTTHHSSWEPASNQAADQPPSQGAFQFASELDACCTNPSVTTDDIARVLQRQQAFGLTDDDLGPALLHVVQGLRALPEVREALFKLGPHPVDHDELRRRNYRRTAIAAVLFILAVAAIAVLLIWLQAPPR